jgi:predicted RNase H-like HicB family nuclease
MYSIRVNSQNHYIRVEEYKRPTFHVEFPEVKEAYAAGDTLTV